MVICLQEIWEPLDMHFHLQGFHRLVAHTRNGNANAGGGIGMFIRNDMDYEEIGSHFAPNQAETHVIHLKKLNIFIINTYRSPSCKTDVFFEQISTTITSLRKNDGQVPKIILCGDFNVDLLMNTADSIKLTELALKYDLEQKIFTPTRIATTTATLIDNIFTNMCSRTLSGTLPMAVSDHCATFLNLPGKKFVKKERKLARVLNENSKNHLRKLLAAEKWEDVIEEKSEKSFVKFHQKLEEYMNIACPRVEKKCVNRNTTKLEPWATAGILTSRATKMKLLKSLKKKGSESLRVQYKQYLKVYTKCIKRAKQLHFQEELQKNCNDPQKTWKLLNEFTGRNTPQQPLPDTFIENNEEIRGDENIAEGFNKFYTNIGPNLAKKIKPSTISYKNYLKKSSTTFEFQEVDEKKLSKIMSSILPKSSQGHDEISNQLLKEIYPAIQQPLLHLINLSLKLKYVPDHWKKAKLIPVFKSGQKNVFTNYRPISLLPTISKVIEKVVAKQVIEYLTRNHLLHNLQFGFRPNHETTHAILKALEKIYEDKEEGSFTVAIFIDLKKAFDTVKHSILLDKLEYLGIDPGWFKSYLDQRPQYTEINGKRSSNQKITTGVPQGSILGPLLFLIYINDLPSSNKFLNILFADDTTFMISENTEEKLVQTVNEELEKAASWFQANELTLHPSKSTFMVFNHKNPQVFNGKIKLQETIMERTGETEKSKSTKFVGIHIDEGLTWQHQINHVRKKMATGIYILNTHKRLLDQKCKVMLYNALIKSHLEYGLAAWHSGKTGSLSILQKKIIRKIDGSRNHLQHTNNLFIKHKILKFEDMKTLVLSKLALKHVSQEMPPGLKGLFKLKQKSKKVTRNSGEVYLEVPKFKYARARNSVLVQCPEAWNKLPKVCKTSKTKSSLVNQLKKHFFEEIYEKTKNCDRKDCYACKQ